MIPWEFIIKTVIPETNKSLQSPMTLGEFLRFLGIRFMIATTNGNKVSEFWSTENVSIFSGAPFRFNHIMSRQRFMDISRELCFTSIPSPQFEDKFHEVREMIAALTET